MAGKNPRQILNDEEHMKKSEQINELAAALAKCQGALRPAKKDSQNPFFKSNYADLESIVAVAREPLAANGLSVTQLVDSTNDGLIQLETILLHSSGQWIQSTMVARPMKSDPQSLGSLISYLRRYSYAALLSIVTGDDDDGEAAMPRNSLNNGGAVASELLIKLDNDLSKHPEFRSKILAGLPKFGVNSILEIKKDLYERISKSLEIFEKENG